MVENNQEDGVRELIEDIRALVYSLSQNSFYEGTCCKNLNMKS